MLNPLKFTGSNPYEFTGHINKVRTLSCSKKSNTLLSNESNRYTRVRARGRQLLSEKEMEMDRERIRRKRDLFYKLPLSSVPEWAWGLTRYYTESVKLFWDYGFPTHEHMEDLNHWKNLIREPEIDIVTLILAFTDDFKSMWWWRKVAKHTDHNLIREELIDFVDFIREGNQCYNRGAAFNARIMHILRATGASWLDPALSKAPTASMEVVA